MSDRKLDITEKVKNELTSRLESMEKYPYPEPSPGFEPRECTVTTVSELKQVYTWKYVACKLNIIQSPDPGIYVIEEHSSTTGKNKLRYVKANEPITYQGNQKWRKMTNDK